ncbi:unnamed protein product [Euphydryas editha]|uniref:Craniofacial development protein 2 n=1 Tax=Euphydryas editha TaxID=104508 RepID=A0AAU9V8U6_EUPED|nr:unnamed protein product [Euphydryas editha]
MGDFNGKIGKRKQGEESIIGKHCIGKRNKNGERVINIALQNNITILNSLFKKKSSRKWAWMSPDGRYHNEIDFIMSNQPRSFQNVDVINNQNFNTNHRMVRATLSQKQHKIQRKCFNLITAALKTHKMKFKKETSKQTNETQKNYNSAISDMYRSETRAKPKRNTLTPKTLDLINKRKELLRNRKDRAVLQK